MKVNITREHEWFTGKDWRWRFIMRDEAGAVIDISGWALAWIAKKPGANAAAPTFIELSGDSVPIIDGPAGVFDVIGEAADVTGTDIGNKEYAHEIPRTDTGYVRVVGDGSAYLRQSISG